MKKFLFILITTGVYSNLVSAQTTRSQVLVMDASKKDSFYSEKLARIDKLIQGYIDSNWIAGAIGLVAQNGTIFYYKSLGYDDKEKGKLLQKDAIFRIASQTKAITAVAVMMLCEEGKFSLDDPISKYIPEFKNPKVLNTFNLTDTSFTTVPAKREITIRDLLTHTSGIGYAQIGSDTMNAIYYKAGISALGLRNRKPADDIKKLATLPLFYQPGETWEYGMNFDVLGYLVEITSGMSLDDFFRKRIFKPLGMRDTYFNLPKEKQPRLMMLYTEDSLRHLVKMKEHIQMNGDFYRDYPNVKKSIFFGGSGLVSTAYDYAIFLQMLLNNGEYNGKRLLKPETIHMMTENQIGNLTDERSCKWGLGFELISAVNQQKLIFPAGSFLWGGMFGSFYWVDPKDGVVAQFVLQQYPNSHNDIKRKFTTSVYQILQ